MKLLHLSDLHLGKRLNGVSLLEDQSDILDQILLLTERADAVLIAGDVYDKSVPSAEAVGLFDRFLTALSRTGKPVFMISGNHDSAQRLAFGGSILAMGNIHISPVFRGTPDPILLEDEYGPVAFWLLPFLKAAHVRPFYEGEELESCEDAVACVLRHAAPDTRIRNVILAHQFVSGASRCESEEVSIGGLDQVSAGLFEEYDYVALGHLHTPQRVGSDRIRYCGSPLKYSVSEAGQNKAALLVSLAEKGSVTVEELPLRPTRDLLTLKGSYDQVTSRAFYSLLDLNNDYHITLTDETDIPQAMARLQTVYPNLLSISYENRRTEGAYSALTGQAGEETDPLALLDRFYRQRNGESLSEEQKKLAQTLMEEIREEEEG